MSKRIVVGIDFSECSLNALEHAVSIAKHAKAGISMVWANHLDYSKEIFASEPESLQDEVKRRFMALVKKYDPVLKETGIDFYIEKGKVYKAICDISKRVDAFLVIVGTHGSSGFEEFWIGSNANRIVSSSKLPIMTIRAGVDSSIDIKTIVMPLDSTVVTRQKAPITALMAKYFDAEVHIVGLLTSSLDDIRFRIKNYVEQTETYFKENGVRFRSVFLEADNITEAVMDYGKKAGANLITIMTEQETTTANLWLGPYATQMVNHSPIPVLSVHPEKNAHFA
ncbi:MAG: universal stress protein [Bacteroidales bacterium]|nr:universal stress protein [Bacteroidales bacterium]